MGSVQSDVMDAVREVEPEYSDHGVPESKIISELEGYSADAVQNAIQALVDDGKLRPERDSTYFVNDL